MTMSFIVDTNEDGRCRHEGRLSVVADLDQDAGCFVVGVARPPNRLRRALLPEIVGNLLTSMENASTPLRTHGSYIPAFVAGGYDAKVRNELALTIGPKVLIHPVRREKTGDSGTVDGIVIEDIGRPDLLNRDYIARVVLRKQLVLGEDGGLLHGRGIGMIDPGRRCRGLSMQMVALNDQSRDPACHDR